MKLRSNMAAAPPGRGSSHAATNAGHSAAIDSVAAELIETGVLSADNLERINAYCVRTGASFADAVVDLGLVTPEAAGRALSAQTRSTLIDPDTSGVSRAVVAAFDPTDPLVIKLRALRAVLFAANDLDRNTMRILVLTGVGTDDTAGVAANLAVLTAQLGMRGLLVDANFAAPAQHVLFGANTDLGITSLLSGQVKAETIVVETPVADLDLLVAGSEIAALSEAVERVSLVAELRALPRRYGFAIVDAGEQPAEMVAAIARGADGVVMVVERDHTTFSSLQALLGALERSGVPVLGSVLAR